MVGKIYTFFNNFGTYTMSQKVYWHCVWTLYKNWVNDIVYEHCIKNKVNNHISWDMMWDHIPVYTSHIHLLMVWDSYSEWQWGGEWQRDPGADAVPQSGVSHHLQGRSGIWITE